jgi:hypothetical protein
MSPPTVLRRHFSEAKAREYLFHHVFLPPKLPQEDDYEAGYDRALLDSVSRALDRFQAHVPPNCENDIASIIVMISRLRNIHGVHGDVSEGIFKTELGKLDMDGKSVRPGKVR